MPSSDWRSKVSMYRFPYLMERLMVKAAEVAADREAGNPLRLSSSGACARKLAYQWINWQQRNSGEPPPYPQEVLQPRALLVFHLGDLVEASLKDWIVKCGDILYGQPGARVTLRLVVDGHTHEIPGHLDGMIQEPGVDMMLVNLEIKSINTRGFDRISAEGPDYGYVCQAHGYMKALGLKRTRILYENKDTSHLDEWVIEFSEDIMAEIEARFAAVIRATPDNLPAREYAAEPEKEWVPGSKNLIGLTDPDKDCKGFRIVERKKTGYWRETGRAKLGFPCSYCPLKATCWGESIEEVVIEDRPTWYVKASAA